MVERIRTHTRRQRAAIPKLTGIKAVRGADDAFAAVTAALAAGPVATGGPGGKGSGWARPAVGQPDRLRSPAGGRCGQQTLRRRPLRVVQVVRVVTVVLGATTGPAGGSRGVADFPGGPDLIRGAEGQPIDGCQA